MENKMIECQICHKNFKQITYKHLKYIHNITINNYKILFSNIEMISLETHNKRSNAISSENNSNFGKFGKNASHFGKHHSKETIEKMKKNHKGMIGKHHSKETIEKISNTNSGENNPNFKNWSSRTPYCYKWDKPLRESIRNQFNRKCYICGKSEEEQMKEQKENGKRQFRLSVHHIDADKEQGCNGKKWKLVPLCLKCHRKVHNHKIKLE